MKIGRQQGLAFLLGAALCVGAELAILSEGITFPFMLICIPVFFLMGTGFLLFPGTAEGREAAKNPVLFWNGGSKRDKIIARNCFQVTITAVAVCVKEGTAADVDFFP